MVRIGILLTLPKQERKKGELLECKQDWANQIPKKFVFDREFVEQKIDHTLCGSTRGKKGSPTDVLIGAYIKNALGEKDVEVDYILPREITKERLASNDMNFLLIYDVLEAFHTDKTPGKVVYNNLKKCLREAKNVFPPHDYQEFIYSKINYYNYLQKKKVAVLPTFTMTLQEYQKCGHDAAVQNVLEFRQRKGLGNVIGKPVYGQEGKDIEWFTGPEDIVSLSIYMRRCMKKYPGLVFQEMVDGFGDTAKSPELRMYHMGNDYKYSVCAGSYSNKKKGLIKFYTPESEGGTLNAPMNKLKACAAKILKKLPKIVMPNGARLPRLITRLDMGWLIDGKYNPFVNEVEFVPSLYAECLAARKDIDNYMHSCAKQMLNITKKFVKREQQVRASRSRASTSKRVLKTHVQKKRQVLPMLKRRARA